MEVRSLKKFKLFLNDRTIIFHNIKVINAGSDIRIISNPLMVSIRPVRLLGICAFDDDGIIGRVIRLPRFMWKMLRNEKRRSKNLHKQLL